MLLDQEIASGMEKLTAAIEPDEKLWENIRREIKQDRPQRTYHRVAVAAVASLTILGAAAVSTPAVARFFRAHQPTPMKIAAAHAVGEEPQEAGASRTETQTLTLDQAKRKAGFNLALPRYLPKGASLVSVQLINDSGNPRVALQYEIGNETLTLQQWKISLFGQPYGPADAAVEVKIGNHHGWAWEFMQTDGITRAVLWDDGAMSWIIHSTLPTEELIKVAETVTVQ